MATKRYGDFESFLASSKGDPEFSFFGTFEERGDAIKAAAVILEKDVSRGVTAVAADIDGSVEIIDDLRCLFSVEPENATATTKFSDIKYNNVVIIQANRIPLGMMKQVAALVTIARHERIVVLVISKDGDVRDGVLRRYSHLTVYKKDGVSLVDSEHKHFLADRMVAWKEDSV